MTASILHLSPSADAARLDEVASRLRERDDAMVDRVLRELVPEVRRWMYRHLGPRSPELEDAAQEALSEIASALHRFEGRSSLATLAHRIALRTSYRYYKKRRPELPPPDESGAPSPEAQVAARRALARLHEALAELPDRRRAAFVLCAVEGLSPQEAADVLGVSPNAMRSLLCRARQQLEEILGDDDMGGAR